MKNKSLVPQPTLFIGDVLDRARAKVLGQQRDDLVDSNYRAMIYFEAFGLIESERGEFTQMARDQQSKLVAAISKEQAWLAVPRGDDVTKIGYADLNAMLLAVKGLSDTARLNFVALGDILLPYFQQNDIDEKVYLDRYSVFVEAIGPIRALVEQYQIKHPDGTLEWVAKKDRGEHKIVPGKRRIDPDAEYLPEVQLILTDVADPDSTREAIRIKHQKHYKPPLGRGGWSKVEDQRVLTLICNSDEDVKEVVARLPRVDWDLVVAALRQNNAIKILAEDEL